MKELIEKWLCDFIEEYETRKDIQSKWKTPIIGYADVYHPIIRDLKNIVSETHHLPEEIIDDAKIVVVYFIPFHESIVLSNIKVADNYASKEWALAYKETNDMLKELKVYLVNKIKDAGYLADYCHDNGMIHDGYYSNYSEKHLAYVAGIGTFGLNNLLISKDGCCGRIGSIITNLDVKADAPLTKERCLYKIDKSCQVCLNSCFMEALRTNYPFQRNKCYQACYRNELIYGGHDYSVCGKCSVGLPCSFKAPINL